MMNQNIYCFKLCSLFLGGIFNRDLMILSGYKILCGLVVLSAFV